MNLLGRLAAGDVRAAMLAYRDGLRAHQEVINRLNVYPVPDGDTGTNMALTLEAVAAELESLGESDVEMSAVCKAGVVDAGGVGVVLLLDALLLVVDGRPLPAPEEAPSAASEAAVSSRPPVAEEGATAGPPGADACAEGVGDLRYEVMFLLEAPDG